jgi:predicted transcriptional regulator
MKMVVVRAVVRAVVVITMESRHMYGIYLVHSYRSICLLPSLSLMKLVSLLEERFFPSCVFSSSLLLLFIDEKWQLLRETFLFIARR